MARMFTPEQLREIAEPLADRALRALTAGDTVQLKALMADMAHAHAGVETLGLHVTARLLGEWRQDFGDDTARAMLDEIAERMMASFAQDWLQGRDELAIRDLIAVFKHQSGQLVPADETDNTVVLDLAPCGSGGRFLVDGTAERSPGWYGRWDDGVSSLCQACKACQRAVNRAVGAPVFVTEISTRVAGRCTIRLGKTAARGRRLFEGAAFFAATQTRIAQAQQLVARRNLRVAELLRDQHLDWRPWHDFQVALLAHLFGASRKAGGTPYLEAKLESAYNSTFRLFYPVFQRLDDETHLRYLATTHHYHMMRFVLSEEDDRFVFRLDPCGSGGRLYRGEIWRGMFRYGDGPTAQLVPEAQPITFGRRDFPVYCSHCAAHNRDQHRHDVLYFVNDGHAQHRPGAPCLQFTYKKGVAAAAVDPAIWRQVGLP
ncbi:hypothetical protein [Pseudorhodoferax sp.]|uniref:hypothetical protein n=1 Tax=Pseudorhodoferax sp. TaxID=1993553 RepID=UPI002DD68435|nr:hypothetical protein [Pseudorhodoferax sp.]